MQALDHPLNLASGEKACPVVGVCAYMMRPHVLLCHHMCVLRDKAILQLGQGYHHHKRKHNRLSCSAADPIYRGECVHTVAPGTQLVPCQHPLASDLCNHSCDLWVHTTSQLLHSAGFHGANRRHLDWAPTELTLL